MHYVDSFSVINVGLGSLSCVSQMPGGGNAYVVICLLRCRIRKSYEMSRTKCKHQFNFK